MYKPRWALHELAGWYPGSSLAVANGKISVHLSPSWLISCALQQILLLQPDYCLLFHIATVSSAFQVSPALAHLFGSSSSSDSHFLICWQCQLVCCWWVPAQLWATLYFSACYWLIFFPQALASHSWGIGKLLKGWVPGSPENSGSSTFDICGAWILLFLIFLLNLDATWLKSVL